VLHSLQEVGPGREAGVIESATLRGGTLSVSGWAGSAHPVAAIVILVEGVPAGFAVPGARAQNEFGQTGVSWSSTMIVEHLLRDGGVLRVSAMTVSEAGLAESFGDMKVTDDPPERVTRASGPVEVDPVDERFLAALRSRVIQSAEVVAGRRSLARHRPEHDGVRVLAVTHDLGYGGKQLYLSELLHGLLDEYGFGCSVVSPSDGPLRRELEERGATVHISGPYMTNPPAYESLMRELALLATEAEVDAVLVNTMGAFCGADLAQRLGLPSLWAIHEDEPFEQYWTSTHGPDGVHPYFRDRAQLALSSATAVLFQTDETRDMWVPNGDPRRFLRVNCGTPIAQIDAYRESTDRLALRHAARHQSNGCVITYRALLWGLVEDPHALPDVLLGRA
jgi:hypothetical protein